MYYSVVHCRLTLLLLYASFVCAQNGRAQDEIEAPRIVLLGTGTPNPEPDHSGPSVAVIIGKNAARGSKRLLIGRVSVSDGALHGFTAFRLTSPRLRFMRGHSPRFRLNGGNREAKSQCQNNVAHTGFILTDPEVQNSGNRAQNRNQLVQ